MQRHEEPHLGLYWITEAAENGLFELAEQAVEWVFRPRPIEMCNRTAGSDPREQN